MWRCHVGLEDRQRLDARDAWDFLRRLCHGARTPTSSPEQAFDWRGCRATGSRSSAPRSTPSRRRTRSGGLSSPRYLGHLAGVLGGRRGRLPAFTRSDGTPGRVHRRAEILRGGAAGRRGPAGGAGVALGPAQGPLGVMLGAFAGAVANRATRTWCLAGPASAAVADDPEGAQVLDEVRAAWRELPGTGRAARPPGSLPMDDVEENAAIVNALQRRAAWWCRRASPRASG